MNETTGIGTGWGWLIIILLFFMAFNGGGLFGTRNNAEALTLTNLERDVLKGNAATDNSILATSCATQKEVFNNRYDNALGVQILGAKLDSCCCDIKTAIHADGEATRNLIQENYIRELQSQLSDTKDELSNKNQSETILNTIGQWRAYPAVNPYTCYNSNICGCV